MVGYVEFCLMLSYNIYTKPLSRSITAVIIATQHGHMGHIHALPENKNKMPTEIETPRMLEIVYPALKTGLFILLEELHECLLMHQTRVMSIMEHAEIPQP